MAYSSRAWVEIDMAALRHNARTLSAAMPAGCGLMAVLKANAYGHGDVDAALELQETGVNEFAVACASEGVRLRESGVEGEILILGYTPPEDFPLLAEYALSQTVVDGEYAECLAKCGLPLGVHVGVDTGMHRLGVLWSDREGLLRAFRAKNLRVRGMLTHLCTDDTMQSEDVAFTREQLRRFYAAVNTVTSGGFPCPKLHIQASYGLVNYPKLKCDYARMGIALYGVLSTERDTEKCALPLRPVASVYARIASVRDISAGESAGYGLKFTAERDTRIAALTIGYADGLPRALSCGKGGVLINGCYAPIVGQICMDQTLVDVSGIPDVRQGGTAVIIGQSGKRELTAGAVAESCGSITNELLSRLGDRLPRERINSLLSASQDDYDTVIKKAASL